MEKALERLHYQEKIKEYTKSDADRHALLLGIVKDNEDLKDQLQGIKRDHDNEKQARCMWQDRVAELQDTLRILRHEAQSSQIVMVILDGDAAIFNDDFYARGRDGGADAAYQVQAFIRNELRHQYPDLLTSYCQLMVSLVLSVQGLSKKLLACNIINRLDQLIEFGHGWVSQPLFTFTDVGHGKERADHKVRETLQAYLPAAHCKHLFVGPCSDNGYLTTLEEIKPNRNMASKVTLIETRTAEPGFDRLGFTKVTIESVFRSTNLPDRVGIDKRAGDGVKTAPAVKPITASPSPVQLQAQPITFPSPCLEPVKNDAQNWVTVGKNLAKGGGINLGRQKAPEKAFILLNRKDERIDPDLEKCEGAAEARFAQRTKDKKMCNDFHLRGSCPNGERKCVHMHGDKLPAAELLVLKQKARGLPCSSGSRCRDFACTFGHHCRFKDDCNYDSCWFKDHHKMDFRPVKKLYAGCTAPVPLV